MEFVNTVKANRITEPSICLECKQPIKKLKHSIICGCGSRLRHDAMKR